MMLGCAATALAAPVKLANGDSYEGDVVDEQRTGRGIYTWADGHRYEGQFLNNRLQGDGRTERPEGGALSEGRGLPTSSPSRSGTDPVPRALAQRGFQSGDQ